MSAKILLALIICLNTSPKSEITGTEILKKMYDRYHNKWYQSFTFDQDTKMYRNDSLVKTEQWHEATIFPDLFRIDLGPKDSGNAVIFRNDSAYRFKKKTLSSVRFYENDLLFLLGGMYYYPFPTVLEKTKKYGYDITKAHTDTWKGKSVYVIGAIKGEDNTNQLWIDAEKLVVVRMLTFKDNQKEEALFEDHLALGSGYTETTCFFYLNGKLFQYEKYHNCRVNTPLDPRFFQPQYFGKYYWF